MDKKTITILVVIAAILLVWYGYNNWGWFGGMKTLGSMMPANSNPTGDQQLPPRSTTVNTNPVR